MGDFNEILFSKEKNGPLNQTKALRFNEMLTYCSLINLGFLRPRFTWTNLQNFPDLVQERLDRAVANSSWRTIFPKMRVTHLPRVYSDQSHPCGL